MPKQKVTVEKVLDFKDLNGEWVRSISLNNHRKYTRAGVLWDSIATRVRNVKDYWLPRYCGFNGFQGFAEWCQIQPNYLEKEDNGKFWALDKDIIKPFNQTYSEDTCCFIPSALNSLFSYSTRKRGEYPLGVYKENNYFKAQGSAGSRTDGTKTRVFLGIRKCPLECHKLWQEEKIRQIHQAISDFSFLPEKVLTGLGEHAKLIQQDLNQGRETLR